MSLLPQFGSIIPSQTQQVLASNYLQWNNSGAGAVPANFADFAQQYLPEIYEAEVERYGNRTLSGFLKMVGAENETITSNFFSLKRFKTASQFTSCSVLKGILYKLHKPLKLSHSGLFINLNIDANKERNLK